MDGNFVSTIHIKNLMSVNPIRVTPALFMADGTEYDLASVSLAPTAVADVNINQALARASGLAMRHLSTYGGAALKYMYPAPGVVAGNINMLDVPDSLVFDNGFQMMMMPNAETPQTSQTLEGVWWKRDAGVGGFVTLTNTTDSTVRASVQVIGEHGFTLDPQTFTLAPHAARMLDLDELTAGLPNQQAKAGGIRVQWYGLMGDVIPAGGLENLGEGYSADMPFWPHNPSSNERGVRAAAGHSASAPRTLTLAAVGVMVGTPDPSMNFPSRTRFTPYVTLRNTTSKPMMVAPALYLANTGQSQSYSLPPQVLAPHETLQVDVAGEMAALKLGTLDGIVNLTYAYTGAVGDLLMAAGSVDRTGTYVFQVLVQAITGSWAKDVPGWMVANGYDTMFTLWNPSAEPEDLMATFHYADGSGTYQLPVHLDAHASMNIDMAQLIALAPPDANGNVFPPGTMSGSVTFSSPKGEMNTIQLAVNAAQYNVGDATCCYSCICCVGVCGLEVSPNPVSCDVNETWQMTAWEYYSNGRDYQRSASWSSADTTVASIDSSGLMTGVAGGKTTIDAYLEDSADAGQLCGCNPYCGQDLTNYSNSATANVDGLVFSITSGGLSTDSSGVIAKHSFNLQVQAENSQGTVPDTSFSAQGVSLTLQAMNTALGETAPSSINFSSGTANATVTIVQASGSESAPSSLRQITVGSTSGSNAATFTAHVYFEVTMDVERWKNCGFVSCPNAGSYFCTTSCDSKGFSSPSSFVAVTESGLCGKVIWIQTLGGTSQTATTIQDCGPASGGGCSNPYWFTGNIPTMGGCLSDALATSLGVANGCNPGPYGQATVLWRFQ